MAHCHNSMYRYSINNPSVLDGVVEMLKNKYIKSIKGSKKENEDVAGSYENYFWVIDGATDVFDAYKKIGITVSDYVRQLSEVLGRLCDNKKTLREIMRQTVEKVSKRYIDHFNFSSEYFAKLPTYAFVFCRELNGKIEYLILGDCFIVYNDAIVSDERISIFSNKNRLEITGKLTESDKISEDERVSVFRETRLLANSLHGYPIGSMNPDSINNAIYGEIPILTGKEISIMTDGFFKFYDKEKDVETILNEILKSGIDDIYGKRDDATIIKGVIS